MKFRLKLMILNMIILLVPFIIVGGIVYSQIVTTLYSNSHSLMVQRLNQEKEKAGIRISSIERLGFQAANHTVLKNFFDKDTFNNVDFITYVREYIDPLSEWLISISDLVSRLSYITRNSQISDTTNIVQYRNVSREPWMMNIEAGTKSYTCYWEALHEQRNYLPFNNTRQELVYSAFFMMPVREKNCTYIEMDIHANDLFDLTNSQPVGKSGYILAVDTGSGMVINSKDKQFEEALLASSQYMSSKKSSEQYFEFSYNKAVYYIGLIKDDKLLFDIMAVVPRDEVIGQLRETKTSFITWIVVAFLSIIVIALLSSLYAAHKVRRITEAVHRIQMGKYDINLPDKGRDELDELAGNINVMAKKIDDLINKVYKSELMHKESMLATLQAQINPHFMFNTLETFRMMIELKGEKELSDAMEVFANVLRYNTYSMKEMVTLSTEFENVCNYITIENMLHNNRLQLTYQLEEGLSHVLIPSFTLQPVVENSIVHGFRNMTSGTLRISISTYIEDEDAVIRILDNGCGITPDELTRITDILESRKIDKGTRIEKSIGLANINERIHLKFGGGYGVSISNATSEGGTVVNIRIPLFAGEV